MTTSRLTAKEQSCSLPRKGRPGVLSVCTVELCCPKENTLLSSVAPRVCNTACQYSAVYLARPRCSPYWLSDSALYAYRLFFIMNWRNCHSPSFVSALSSPLFTLYFFYHVGLEFEPGPNMVPLHHSFHLPFLYLLHLIQFYITNWPFLLDSCLGMWYLIECQLDRM